MKISTSWLKEYIPLEMAASDLADLLTMAGLEVDSVSNRYEYLDTVLTGRITDINAHPNARKLRLCTVDIGKCKLTVVCGAPNAEVNMISPVALPGTVFPNGVKLEKSAIRGQVSEGMLCSEAELGLGPDQSGIMALDASLAVGQKLARALKLIDTVFEIDLTPNRPDCLSIIGITREIAALQKTELACPQVTADDEPGRASEMTSVRIEAPEHCPRYAARLLEGIAVAPSPFWLQDRLLSVGLRPINNIVDITNFVMMETGQPLHAFDFDRLAQNRIVVRTAQDGERFTTLDQKERILETDMLMICDGEKPVAVAGVMGGVNSEIEQTSTRILLESAYFNPVSIRKTSKRLGLSTDASHRFERGVDPQGTVFALNRAAQLMAEIGKGTLVPGVIDEYVQVQPQKRITLSTARTNRLLGTSLTRAQIDELLQPIEFKTEKKEDPDTLLVIPPSFRVDISRPEDLMEEVARLWGYNRIPITYPMMPAQGRPSDAGIEFRAHLKQLMTGFSFAEVINYSFAHPLACDRLRLNQDDMRRKGVSILNPLAEDQALMRTSLIPGLLETMGYNQSGQVKDLKVFEIGKIFISDSADQLPQEPEVLAGLWTGARAAAFWGGQVASCDFFDIKGLVEGLFAALKIEGIRFSQMPATECRYVKAGHSAQVLADDTVLGLVGEVDPLVLENFSLKQPAFIFELELAPLTGLLSTVACKKPVPKFPAVFRDTTIILDRDIEFQEMVMRTEALKEKLVESLDLFDVYEGKPIPAGKKSISFRITYRAADKTLQEKDVTHLHQSITQRLLAAFDATLP